MSARERKCFGLLTTLDLLISIADILALMLLVWSVQRYVQNAPLRLHIFSYHFDLTLQKWLPPTIIGGFFFTKNLFAYLHVKHQNQFSNQVALRLSNNQLAVYQCGAYTDFVEKDAAHHLRNIAFQPFEFSQYVLSGFQQIFTQFFLVSFTALAIVFVDWRLFTLLAIVIGLPAAWLLRWQRKAIASERTVVQQSNEDSYRYLLDALHGYVLGNLHQRNQFFRQRFLHERTQFGAALFRTFTLQSLPSRLIELFAIAGLLLLIGFSQMGSASSGNLLLLVGAFSVAAYKLIPGLVKIINLRAQINAYDFSLLRAGKNEDLRENEPVKLPIESIALRDLHFGYRHFPIVSDINISLKRGDFAGVVGPSGSGKSTIFNLLSGFLEPANGAILYNQNEVPAEAIRNYWTSMAHVRQNCFLIHDTVERNITLEHVTLQPSRLKDVLELSGLNKFFEETNQNQGMKIAEGGKNISGGQQQRIAIARALYRDADLFLLDEPFNELDEDSENILLEHFSTLARSGRIVLMITHKRHSLRFCNKTLSLYD